MSAGRPARGLPHTATSTAATSDFEGGRRAPPIRSEQIQVGRCWEPLLARSDPGRAPTTARHNECVPQTHFLATLGSELVGVMNSAEVQRHWQQYARWPKRRRAVGGGGGGKIMDARDQDGSPGIAIGSRKCWAVTVVLVAMVAMVWWCDGVGGWWVVHGWWVVGSGDGKWRG